jgi:hypothetical protein
MRGGIDKSHLVFPHITHVVPRTPQVTRTFPSTNSAVPSSFHRRPRWPCVPRSSASPHRSSIFRFLKPPLPSPPPSVPSLGSM